MEGGTLVAIEGSNNYNSQILYAKNAKQRSESLVIEASFAGGSEAVSLRGMGRSNLGHALVLSAEEIISKINQLLRDKVPQGIESLDPAEFTPEATADKIVKGVTSLFSAYAKQNPKLDPEKLISSFMEQVRSGVDRGYSEAFEILEGLGAFKFDGVQSGIEKTKQLVGERLAAFEDSLRKSLGVKVEADTSDDVRSKVLTSAGTKVLDIAA